MYNLIGRNKMAFVRSLCWHWKVKLHRNMVKISQICFTRALKNFVITKRSLWITCIHCLVRDYKTFYCRWQGIRKLWWSGNSEVKRWMISSVLTLAICRCFCRGAILPSIRCYLSKFNRFLWQCRDILITPIINSMQRHCSLNHGLRTKQKEWKRKQCDWPQNSNLTRF